MDEITKLKAKAYDLVAQIQQAQRQLDETNQQIVALLEHPPKTGKKLKQ